ncbi:Ribosomal protein L9/RNase H1, N-terminal [Phaffia rhodozyma]|uniref:Ribosomal protein L9/RNase H1, N-terminal n=1 Tax=Phaffia rhodozyma TaxID=264483 RepID=A0A0F7SKF5_PHARH|nr:Ribosomal protein L9/RNase H1, N-terminal [Phaffia rhodozyma]
MFTLLRTATSIKPLSLRALRRNVCRKIVVANPTKLETKNSIPIKLLEDDIRLGKKGDLVAVHRKHMRDVLYRKEKAAYILSNGVARVSLPHPEAVTIKKSLDRSALEKGDPVLTVLRQSKQTFKSGLPSPWQVRFHEKFQPKSED